jgi:LmbE family N-acetylglucosaminyl deacetylase
MNILIILTLIIIAISTAYAIIIFVLHDTKIPSLKTSKFLIPNSKFTKVLFIYPHPDDELNSDNLISHLLQDDEFEVFVVSTTHGEHGDELLKVSPAELAMIRKNEFINGMKTLGVSNYDLWNFVDGDMVNQEFEIRSRITTFIKENDINLVVTYEKFGLYGHPDHMILSKIVNQISKEINFKVLYTTLPEKILKRIKLPKTLTYKDRVVELTLDKIADPEFKLGGFRFLVKRYLAAKQYKSQKINAGIPLWLLIMLKPLEYYTTKYDSEVNG